MGAAEGGNQLNLALFKTAMASDALGASARSAIKYGKGFRKAFVLRYTFSSYILVIYS